MLFLSLTHTSASLDEPETLVTELLPSTLRAVYELKLAQERTGDGELTTDLYKYLADGKTDYLTTQPDGRFLSAKDFIAHIAQVVGTDAESIDRVIINCQNA